jgi:hypothetical protein
MTRNWTIPNWFAVRCVSFRNDLPGSWGGRFRICVSLIVFLLGFSASSTRLVAQTVSATLTGNVADPSGALIPGAKVTAHNDATGAERYATAGVSGNFAIPELAVGTYTVTVEFIGFERYIAQNVVLNVGDHRDLVIQLNVGKSTSTVTVTSAIDTVDTQSSSQDTTITAGEIEDLELDGRHFETLVSLQPGVVGSGQTLYVNGNRYTGNNWTVDGADVVDSGSNGSTVSSPALDSIAEFKTARSSYDAQYGRGGGAQISVVTKGGTTSYHGDAFEYIRNTAFDANDYFNKNFSNPQDDIPRQQYHYNNFGGTFGGPVPFENKKLFFFVSEEWRKFKYPSTITSNVPSTAELGGDFSDQASQGLVIAPSLLPSGCLDNTGYVISSTCFSNNAKLFLQNVWGKLPPPNSTYPGVAQYIWDDSNYSNTRQDSVRLDYNSRNWQAFVRVTNDNQPSNQPTGLYSYDTVPGYDPTITEVGSRTYLAHLTNTFTPRVVNELEYEYTRGSIDVHTAGGADIDPTFFNALTPITTANEVYGRVPIAYIYGNWGDPGSPNVDSLSNPEAPYRERNIDHQFFDNLVIDRGRHSLRAGFMVQTLEKTENFDNNTNGIFEFYDDFGLPTEDYGGAYVPAWGSFLLGQAGDYQYWSRDIIPDLHYNNIEAYFQDDWKVTKRLTVNLGVRYSLFPPPSDSTGTMSGFDPALFKSAAAPTFAPNGSVTSANWNPSTYLNGIIIGGPGASPYPGTTSPWGYKVNPTNKKNFGPRIGLAWDPFGNGKTSVRSGYGIYYDRSLNGIWEQNQSLNPPFIQAPVYLYCQGAANSDSGTGCSPGVDSFDAWNSNATLDAAVNSLHTVGGPNLPNAYTQSWNLSVQRQWGNNVFEVAYIGTRGTHLLGAISLNEVPAAIAEASPNTNANAERPYPGYGKITAIEGRFSSHYNGFQASWDRKVAKGLNGGATYTYASCITNNNDDRFQGAEDTYNLSYGRGLCKFGNRELVTAHYIYDLPIFQHNSRWMGNVLGGWKFSGITIFTTGDPLTPVQSRDPFWTSRNRLGIGLANGTTVIPDRGTGSPYASPRTVNQWFTNANGAYADAKGHFGNSGVSILTGPHYLDFDWGLRKTFKFTDRINLQYSADAFNVFNHANFADPNMNIDSTFGQITSDIAFRDMQMGLKLKF